MASFVEKTRQNFSFLLLAFVHVSPTSVSPNLWIDSIEVEDVYLYDELGIDEDFEFTKLY